MRAPVKLVPDLAHWNGGPSYLHRVLGRFSFRSRRAEPRCHATSGDAEHIKVFAKAAAAETWFAENDPEVVAVEYEVRE